MASTLHTTRCPRCLLGYTAIADVIEIATRGRCESCAEISAGIARAADNDATPHEHSGVWDVREWDL